jgi:ABC-type antimicrobial peptide transport system permease subunit
VANLMLARAASRQKEFAVRLAIGAGRGRLIRQTLTEALVLVGLGGALGAAVAVQAQAALATFFSDGADRIVLDLSMNGRVLFFTLAISVLTGVAFGLLPALGAARVDPSVGLQTGARTGRGASRGAAAGCAWAAPWLPYR